jgi:transposase
MKRRKFTSKFKTEVALATLKERESLAELARKYELHPQQITKWKREFLEGSESIFSSKKKSPKTEAEEKEEALLKIIGQQKVEIDFLKKNLS